MTLEAVGIIALTRARLLAEQVAIRLTLLARLQIVTEFAALLVQAALITLIVEHEVARLACLALVFAAVQAAVFCGARDASVLCLGRVAHREVLERA